MALARRTEKLAEGDRLSHRVGRVGAEESYAYAAAL